ncbi:Na/Pi cotransporter family protein [Marinobacterium jannaschii]|uniref:Na/Pi cotransporter family protein n=1 Tax=Marinobacterium jannaschii TaxID=64970 RepID=UPI00048463B8|nr:Na/Pi cotransporter family protein [Marinobacterium jannaschii]
MYELIGTLAGGVGLFLLGIHLMTGGLKNAAGPALKKALKAATGSPLRGLVSGTLITALVQSSTAVTITTIGFVNTGLLNLGQSVAVIYGSNIGTTLTSWLVALIGFKFKIGAVAMPMVAIGMAMKLVSSHTRYQQTGIAITGFGVFFIGLDFLKDAFIGLDSSLPLASLSQHSMGILLLVAAGFVLTFLLQSSAAAMAITLSLTAAGSIPLIGAAAMVIGANVGTTSTAVLAVIGATANAKRVAAVHVLFNLITAVVGITLLLTAGPLLQNYLSGQALDLVILLALFHTLFNLLGVALIWPFSDQLTRQIKRRFRSQEEDEGKPRYLDKNILYTPSLALEAVKLELTRIGEISNQMARQVLSNEYDHSRPLQPQLSIVQRLVSKLGKYNQALARQKLGEDTSPMLPVALKAGRNFSELARLATRLPEYTDALNEAEHPALQKQIYNYLGAAATLLDSCKSPTSSSFIGEKVRQKSLALEQQYKELKGAIHNATLKRKLKPKQSMSILDALSHIQRMSEQADQGARYLKRLQLSLAKLDPPEKVEQEIEEVSEMQSYDSRPGP